MFGFLKKVKNTTTMSNGDPFLDKVDLLYQKAFTSRNPSVLDGYMTKKCLSSTAERIRLNDSSNQGISRYRHTVWTKLNATPESTDWRREVTYDDIKMSYGITIPVGDATTEIWTVVFVDNKQLVASIKGDCNG